MEFLLRHILPFYGRSFRLRGVCSSWRDYIDINDKEIVDSLYYKYQKSDTDSVHDLVHQAVQCRDIDSVRKLYIECNTILPVDWKILACYADPPMRELITSRLVPLERNKIRPIQSLSETISYLVETPIPNTLHEILVNDSIELVQSKYTSFNVDYSTLVTLSAAYDAKKIFKYLNRIVSMPVTPFLSATGSVLKYLCKNPRFYMYYILEKNISSIQRYSVLSHVLEDPYVTIPYMYTDLLALCIVHDYTSLVDRYINHENIAEVLTSRLLKSPSRRMIAFLQSKNMYIHSLSYLMSSACNQFRRSNMPHGEYTTLYTHSLLHGNSRLMTAMNKCTSCKMDRAVFKGLIVQLQGMYDESIRTTASAIIGLSDNLSIAIIEKRLHQSNEKSVPLYHKYLLDQLLAWKDLLDMYRRI